MIGSTVRQKAKGSPEFTVVGFDQGSFVLQNKAHDVAITVTPEELRSGYGVPRAAAPEAGTAEKGWARLNAILRERKPLHGARGLTPDQALDAQADTAAKAAAAKIVTEADEDEIADFEAGLKDYPPAVARAVEVLLAERRD